jgi:hypothetical protein
VQSVAAGWAAVPAAPGAVQQAAEVAFLFAIVSRQ